MKRGTRDALRIAADGGPFLIHAIDPGPEQILVRKLLRAAAESDENRILKAIEILEGR